MYHIRYPAVPSTALQPLCTARWRTHAYLCTDPRTDTGACSWCSLAPAGQEGGDGGRIAAHRRGGESSCHSEQQRAVGQRKPWLATAIDVVLCVGACVGAFVQKFVPHGWLARFSPRRRSPTASFSKSWKTLKPLTLKVGKHDP